MIEILRVSYSEDVLPQNVHLPVRLFGRQVDAKIGNIVYSTDKNRIEQLTLMLDYGGGDTMVVLHDLVSMLTVDSIGIVSCGRVDSLFDDRDLKRSLRVDKTAVFSTPGPLVTNSKESSDD